MKRYILISLIFIFLMANTAAQELNLSEMTLREKVGQMVIAKENKYDDRLLELGIGGIFLDNLKTEKEYKEVIERYQKNSELKLFIATDMEGYWNPFRFFQTKTFGEIASKEEAYQLGKLHGEILRKLGFNLNFSPVVETKNNVWLGRSFTGTNKEIKEKISGYIKGLQEQKILATAKHYPGGSMVSDPHKFKVRATISEEELDYFNHAIKENVSAIMVGHAIVSGAVDSKAKQSTVSPEVISVLRKDFRGIIITDAISMWGLKISYLFNRGEMYVNLVNAGNDIILDTRYFLNSHKRAEKIINEIVLAVENGEISERKIDESVTRILKAKGYDVIQ